ncbi:hypothetical protein BpHYR1_047683 [Brachionus plicatilis]|uniref:Uncharacterized protein n=1 Tax=Brachionus plicatilis TaxID=10195 RepID=A0A3M7T2W2_BRAPC|nr:hypothetical protein BpHYR1_047683 [Brachionus plicatilis]
MTLVRCELKSYLNFSELKRTSQPPLNLFKFLTWTLIWDSKKTMKQKAEHQNMNFQKNNKLYIELKD